jgi:hypothetical protein
MTQSAGVHTCALTRTNSAGVVAVCSCGWYGIVHPSHVSVPLDGKRGKRVYTDAEAAAIEEHVMHERASRELTFTRPVEQYAHTVINTSRFGHA